MLMILARLVRSESFWAVAKVRSPHTGPEFGYPRPAAGMGALATVWGSAASARMLAGIWMPGPSVTATSSVARGSPKPAAGWACHI